MKKEVVVIRLNPKVLSWYKQIAEKEQMTKSELIRNILTKYKEEYNDKTTNK